MYHQNYRVTQTFVCFCSIMMWTLSSQHRAAVIILVTHALVFGTITGTDDLASLPYFKMFLSTYLKNGSNVQSMQSEVGPLSIMCVLLMIESVMLPVGGWLADVYLGRYKVIRASIWGMWAAVLVVTAGSTLLSAYQDIYTVRIVVVYIAYPIALLTLTILKPCFMANVLAFLLDNLHSESSTTLQRYVYLYVWTYFVGARTLVIFLPSVSDALPISPQLIQQLTMAVSMTVAVCVDICCRQYLNTAFQTKNPIKLVGNVLRYALKNKYPRCRSAFTYCEDTIPSRIDLAMTKYGGPFREEEVNDVKTLGRILLLVPPFAFGCIAFRSIFSLLNISTSHFQQCKEPFYISLCYHAVIILGIPALFFVQSKVCKACKRRPNPMRVSVAGYFVLLICSFVTIAFLLMSVTQMHKLILIPLTLLGVAYTLIFPAANEFFCAQAPHQMRGMLIGFAFATQTIAELLQAVILMITERIPLSGTSLSTNQVFAMIVAVLAFVGFWLVAIFAKTYKRRVRNQTTSVYRFAEDYYSNLIANYPRDTEDEDDEESLENNIYAVH